jgi:hypothetical protein
MATATTEDYTTHAHGHERCQFTNSPNRSCEYIIEFEGFRDCSNLLVVKELTILNYTLKTVNTYLFKCPHNSHWRHLSPAIRKTNQYISEHIHGIRYHGGDVPYDQLHYILLKHTASSLFIYTNGSEKSAFLSQILGKKVTDLGTSILPRLKLANITLPSGEHFYSCSNHCRFDPSYYSCSLTKAFRFAECLRLAYKKVLKLSEPNRRLECSTSAGREYLLGAWNNSLDDYELYCKGVDEVDNS